MKQEKPLKEEFKRRDLVFMWGLVIGILIGVGAMFALNIFVC